MVKKNKQVQKIGFFGESVASGFLLSPYFTPASFLEKLINVETEKEENPSFQVIDFSEVSLRIDKLYEYIKENSDDLQAAVIFAGNNWRKDFWDMDENDYKDIYEKVQFAETHWTEIYKDKFKSMMNPKIEKLFQLLQEKFVKKDIPVLFVLPEFNLRDWGFLGKNDTTMNYPNESASELAEGEKAMTEEEKLTTTIQKDPSNPKAYTKLGRFFDKQQDYEKAFDYYVKGLNTNIFRLGPPPAINDYLREMIVTEAAQYNVPVLDLRAAFNDVSSGKIAGNNYFLDYCHLNVEGIVKTCDLIASALGMKKNEEHLKTTVVEPSVISNAYFYAAVHSAHLENLEPEYLEYLLTQALTFDEDIAQKMRAFIKISVSKIPWRLNVAYLELYSLQYPSIRQPKDCMVMDVELVQCMIRTLKSFGINLEKETIDTQIAHHSVTKQKPTNLLESYYKESSYFNIFSDSKSIDFDKKELAYSRFRAQQSNFYFICDQKEPITGKILVRNPQLKEESSISLFCNDVFFKELIIDKNWQEFSFVIPESLMIKNSVNHLTIKWPVISAHTVSFVGQTEMESTYQEKVIDSLRPVYGEIYTLDLQKTTNL